MRIEDVDAVESLTRDTFHDLQVRTRPADWPVPRRRSAERRAEWRRRCRHLVERDPGGCWVAEDRRRLLGAATSLRREDLWGLSTYAVLPGTQQRGVGRLLLDAALGHSEGCLRGMICSSHDPRAVRRYRLAGFTLHPTMVLRGLVQRAALPVVEHVREGSPSDADLLNTVDRLIRGAAHGPDHELMARTHRLVLIDRPNGRGYCYLYPDGGPYLLAASNRRTATALLWHSLAEASRDEPVSFGYVTPEQEWAIDTGLAAGLQVRSREFLALRNMTPPMPYIPSGHFL
ncbi:MAG: GNAT family N-acetyltransferase [Propionibacteriales bacterium]|nr:GNAT family N-acetyltransferase [Propionibacteriales bacterium]